MELYTSWTSRRHIIVIAMRLIIRDNAADVALWAASYIKARIHKFAPTAERPFVLGLPTGA